MEHLSRRRFLKISAATFAAAGFQTPVIQSLAMGTKPAPGKVETIEKARNHTR